MKDKEKDVPTTCPNVHKLPLKITTSNLLSPIETRTRLRHRLANGTTSYFPVKYDIQGRLVNRLPSYRGRLFSETLFEWSLRDDVSRIDLSVRC